MFTRKRGWRGTRARSRPEDQKRGRQRGAQIKATKARETERSKRGKAQVGEEPSNMVADKREHEYPQEITEQ